MPESQFSDRAIIAIFVDYTKSGYVLWHPETRNNIVSRHVKYNEKLVYKDLFCKTEIAKSETMTDINDCDWLENSEELEPNAKDSEQPSKIISETPRSDDTNRKTKKTKQSQKSDSEPQNKITRHISRVKF